MESDKIMNPKIYNIEMKRGADFNLELRMLDDNDAPIDLSNYSWRSQMRERPESELSYDFVINTTPSKGIVTMSMAHGVTEQIMFTNGVYDLYYITAGGEVECLIQGQVTVIWKSTDLNDTGIPLPYDPIKVLGIVNGGTGAETAVGARANLGLAYETSTANIKPAGTVSVGVLDTVARADHVHPESRPFETSTANIKPAGTASVGVLDTIPRADHVHPSNVVFKYHIYSLTLASNVWVSKELMDSTEFSAEYYPMSAQGYTFAGCLIAEGAFTDQFSISVSRYGNAIAGTFYSMHTASLTRDLKYYNIYIKI